MKLSHTIAQDQSHFSSKSRSGKQWLAGLLLLLIVLVAVSGCVPNANAGIVSPDLGDRLYALEAEGELVIEPTPEPLAISTMSEEEIYAGLPADFATALENATAANGETLALANGCIGCHALDPSQQMTGPTWYQMGDTAANRRPDQSPALYLHNSIVLPNEYVVDGYPSGVMPQNYNDLLSTEDLADMVAYLLAQHE